MSTDEIAKSGTSGRPSNSSDGGGDRPINSSAFETKKGTKARVLGLCLRCVYDPDSQYLTEHYRLGEELGKGQYGVVYGARLRLKSHVYAKRVVGKQKDANPHMSEQEIVDNAKAQYGDAVGDWLQRLQNRANLDTNHYVQGLISFPFACKIMKKSQVKLEAVLREIHLLERCQQRRILLLVEYFETTNKLHLITGRCYGDVAERNEAAGAGNLPVNVVARWVDQLVEGLAHMHSVSVLHRDIKMENLLVISPAEDGDIAIGDFGFAEDVDVLNKKKQMDICGTPTYLSPEVCRGGRQSPSSDMWSAGIMLYLLMVGKHPYQHALEGPLPKQPRTPAKSSKNDEAEKKRSDEAQKAMRESCVIETVGDKVQKMTPVQTTDRQLYRRVACQWSSNTGFLERFMHFATCVNDPTKPPDYAHPRWAQLDGASDCCMLMMTVSRKERPTCQDLYNMDTVLSRVRADVQKSDPLRKSAGTGRSLASSGKKMMGALLSGSSQTKKTLG